MTSQKSKLHRFSDARGVTDTPALLDEIERADAWSFTSRPQDLQEVIDFWNTEKRMGTRLQLMRKSIERRLTERDEKRGNAMPIAPAQAREGARLAAAAATLTQNPAIRVPDGAENANGIPLRAVLPDWDNRLQNTLLSFPIFDNAIYGTVRFHHRSVREYLTAEWLDGLLAQPVSRRAVEALFFQEKFGLQVIVPAMRPILPWLAILNDRIRDRIREIAPELIFEGGDPSALPLPVRKTILAEVCVMMADEQSLRDNATDYSAVQRFANSDLADDIRQLMAKYAANDAITGFLVRMIWLGRLEALLPEARRVAIDPQTSTYTRIAAFRTIRAVGQSGDQAEIREAFLAEAPRLKREWLEELLRDLKSTDETNAWLLASFEKVEPKAQYRVDGLGDAISSFVRTAPIDLVPSLVAGLVNLLGRPPVIDRGFCHVSERYDWLMNPAVVAVERLIAGKHSYALQDACLDVMHKFRAVRHWKDELKEIKDEFSKLVPEWSELNRAAFWYDVHVGRRRIEKKPGERLTYFWQASLLGSFWKFGASDFEYAIEAVTNLPELDNKLVALSLAHAIYSENGRNWRWRDELKASVAGNTELSERLEQLLNPPPHQGQHRREERRWKRNAAERARRKAEQYEKSKQYILKSAEGLRDPKLKKPADISKAQWYLHEELRNTSTGSSNHWTEGRWRELVPSYGEEVACAYRDGAIAYWRRYKPVLRSEGAADNSTPIFVVFGLTGLAIDVRNPTLPSTLVRTISRTGNQPASRSASTVIDRAWENWPPSSDLQDQNSKHSGGRHVLTK